MTNTTPRDRERLAEIREHVKRVAAIAGMEAECVQGHVTFLLRMIDQRDDALRDARRQIEDRSAEIERLHNLFRLDGEQHANHVRGLTDQHETRLQKYIEAVRERDAEIEGWRESLRHANEERDAVIEEQAATIAEQARRLELWQKAAKNYHHWIASNFPKYIYLDPLPKDNAPHPTPATSGETPGLFASLAPEQQKAALEYRGPDDLGMRPADKATPERPADMVERALPADFDKKTEINKRVAERYKTLRALGAHGVYETIFKIVHEERAAVREEATRQMGEWAAQYLENLAAEPDAVFDEVTLEHVAEDVRQHARALSSSTTDDRIEGGEKCR